MLTHAHSGFPSDIFTILEAVGACLIIGKILVWPVIKMIGPDLCLIIHRSIITACNNISVSVFFELLIFL